MTEKKIAFTCGWGQSSQELYNKYKVLSPNRSGSGNGLMAVPNIDDADVVFMFDGMSDIYNYELIKKLKTKKLFAVRTEPPCVNKNPIIVPHSLLNVITIVDFNTQPIWYFSKWWEMSKVYSNEDFLNMPYEKRTEKLSCLLSDKNFTPGHKKRQRFVKNLITSAPNLLTLYGRNKISTNKGSLAYEKKYLAYKGFEYTLCFENCTIPNYFTDKIFDAMLMWSMPIYFGAPNVGDYLPTDSYHALSDDLDEKDVEMVKDICNKPPSNKNIKAIKEARQLILQKHSLWPTMKYVLKNY